MPILSRIALSSVFTLTALLAGVPGPVAVVATPLSGGSLLGHVAARHLAGASPNHVALARKRSPHNKRSRCKQRSPTDPSSSPPAQPTTTDSGSNYNPANGDTGNTGSGSTSTPAPQPTPIYNGPDTGTGKLILAWPNGAQDNMDQIFTGNARIYYTWSPHKVNTGTGNVRFCAMLWGYKDLGDFQNLVVPGYADCVLGMNEVNQHDQSAMNTDQGADLWNQHIGPLASQGYSILGSPSTTSAPDGLLWIQEWLPKVSVKPNVITLHFYDKGFDKFQQYVTGFYTGTGSSYILWVTEFACQDFNGGPQCSEGEIWSFNQAATQWMDSVSWVGGYAPFGFMRDMTNVNPLNRLMNDDGTPTALGSFFIHSA